MNKNEIYEQINKKFNDISGHFIEEGTVLDFFNSAVSESVELAYKQIEENKNPHLYTGLKGDELDQLGFFLNTPREVDEADDSYRFRLMNWKQASEASNLTSIEVALMNMTYASNVTYVPLTHGCGTATAYIIPKSYDEDIMNKAIFETVERLKKVTSPSTFITFTIPVKRPVKFVFYLTSKKGDIQTIKNNIENKVKNYVNSIAPGEYLDLGEINRIGVLENNVDFFKISQTYISNESISKLEILQKIDSKFLFDEIIWWEV